MTIKKSTAAKPDAEQLMALSPYTQLLEPDNQRELRKLVEAVTSEGPSLKRLGSKKALGLVLAKSKKVASGTVTGSSGSKMTLDLFDV